MKNRFPPHQNPLIHVDRVIGRGVIEYVRVCYLDTAGDISAGKEFNSFIFFQSLLL